MKKIIYLFFLIFVALPLLFFVGIFGALAESLDSILTNVMNRLEYWAYKDKP